MLAPRPTISPAFKKNTSLATPGLSTLSDDARSQNVPEWYVDLKERRWCNTMSVQAFGGRVLSPETRAAMKRWEDMEEDMFWTGWTQAVDEVQADDVDDDAEVINEQEQKTREVCAEIDGGEHWLNEQLPAEQRDAWLRVFKMFDDAWHEVEAEGAKTEVEVAVPESEELPVFSQEQTYQLLTKTIEIEHQKPWLNKQLPVEQREAWSRVFDIFDDARRELEGGQRVQGGWSRQSNREQIGATHMC
ncbi:hypothetical protein HETIRDRAFT_117222 [Heterobasidion irregulare TC 32-1]|uniref:Uncharacterized protein n=1 Tax=Heterobasidion irregulare (strain TC 32-1) TaxID=747525 RepID=W4K3L6_HETIT|nr:uncharacterized protein HETIRDRAFT_117222 [Heterobasidion irregulare TC 32-1]ETW79666.1 hypothetical protein HETIRDRAFT_117222 [Heterobasidion irregulare TC 32-1]